MPHVVIEEVLDLGLACQGIKIAAVRNGSEILKVMDVYLSRSGHTTAISSEAPIVSHPSAHDSAASVTNPRS